MTGTAAPYSEVHVWPHATGEEVMATTDVSGFWQAEFSGLFDLVQDEAGFAERRDDVGNATAVEWYVLPPARIVTQITDDWFEAQNFAPHAELTYWIYDTLGGGELLNGTLQTDNRGTVGI